MKKTCLLILCGLSFATHGIQQLPSYTVKQLLSVSAEPNTQLLGSTAASIPALLASSLIIKVDNLLLKHGSTAHAKQTALHLQNALLIDIKKDRALTSELIHHKKINIKLNIRSKNNTQHMISTAKSIAALAHNTLILCKQKNVPHLDWYRQDLDTATKLANSSANALKSYR